MRSRVLVATLAAAAAAAGLVLAQVRAPARRTLHEDLPMLAASHSEPAVRRKDRDGNPTAIVAGDRVLPQPQLGTAPVPGEPVLGSGTFEADRATEWKPDARTDADANLHYASVFNPDVIPFKRMTVFDAIRDDYTLHVSRTGLTELAVGGTHDPRTHDRFWGEVHLQLERGVDVPLPSVAPDMRILSYQVKPAIRLTFSKDGADNYFVRSDEPTTRGRYHLVFWADADARYFAPSLPPRGYTVDEARQRTPPELFPQIPDPVRREAERTLRGPRFGVHRATELAVAFDRLVSYFRAFQAGEIQRPTGDIYRDLCDSQAGVCRHRAFAFMVTATALGIATRYVQNEAHAFVEVWFPERGWQRIDLGGAALRMDVTGMNDKEVHRPRADDPFSKPRSYREQYTLLEGDIRGMTERQKQRRRMPADQAPTSGQVAVGADQQAGDVASDSLLGPDRITPDPTAPARQADPDKPTPVLAVTQADGNIYRGETMHVEGIARAGGRGIANHRVDVFLSPVGQDGRGSIPIGYAVTGADGAFRVDLQVPPTVDLTRYEIRLSSSEDAFYNPALSD